MSEQGAACGVEEPLALYQLVGKETEATAWIQKEWAEMLGDVDTV